MSAALLALVVAGAAPANFPPMYWWYENTLIGVGEAASPVIQDPAMTLTAEIGERPFGGALSTGVSLSSATALDGSWNVMTPGIFARLDLTYVGLSGFWSRVPTDFPFRIIVGVGVGMAISQSFFQANGATDGYQTKTSYVLVRPQLQPALDIEIPFGAMKRYAVLLRGSFDAPVSVDSVFRFSGLIGLSVSWDRIAEPQ